MRALPFVLFLQLATFALARNKPPYEVGTFMSSQQVSDGTYSTASCGSFGCNGSAYNAAHNVHLVNTPDGIFSIEAPVSVAGTFLLGMANNGIAPVVHKAWFMDDLHEGDKVLFSAQCNKHNRCTIRLPNPDKPDKEIVTLGFFYPAIAKTNTTTLCGTGKLTAVVEAEVCTQGNPPLPPAVPNPTPVGAQMPVSAARSGPLDLYETMNVAAKQNDTAVSSAPDSVPASSPETPTADRDDIGQKVVEGINTSFRKEGVVGYADLSGNDLTIHSERASPMRFHMMLANQEWLSLLHRAGIATIIYTDDADQRFVYDVNSSKGASAAKEKAPTAVTIDPSRQCRKYLLNIDGRETCTEWSSK